MRLPFGIVDFYRDARRILADREACAALVGSAYFHAITISGACLFFARPGIEALLLACLGMIPGFWLASLQRHPRRVLGLVPFGAVGLAGSLAWAAAAFPSPWPTFAIALTGGLLVLALRAFYHQRLPADVRANGLALLNVGNFLSTAPAVALVVALPGAEILPATRLLWILAGLAAIGLVVATPFLLRQVVEQIVEILLEACYRITTHGPGFEQFPRNGPVIVIANHTAWFDPLWIGKVVPRSVIPMMTSKYYDRPILHWLMRHVARAIRVPAAAFRREAPELVDAVAVLDRGECLIIFPEGSLRRKEEHPLRQFGQGVWRILEQRPETPVVCCWVEGGWGSFTSYKGGLPLKGKPIDRRRPINIGIAAPEVLERTLLANQRATRAHLMQRVSEARRFLGLEPIVLQTRVRENDLV